MSGSRKYMVEVTVDGEVDYVTHLTLSEALAVAANAMVSGYAASILRREVPA